MNPMLADSLSRFHKELVRDWERQTDYKTNETDNKNVDVPATVSSKTPILLKIEQAVLQVMECLEKQEVPVFAYPDTSTWDNIRFDKSLGIRLIDEPKMRLVRLDKQSSCNKFNLMLKVLFIIHKLLQENKYSTKRDIFYQNAKLFVTQSTLDIIVDIVANMLGVSRWELHVLATSKGCVIGDLCFYNEDGDFIDCHAEGSSIQIPAHRKDMQKLQTAAKFILVVEKDATFQKLIHENVTQKLGPCVMITGKGFPDIGTRLLLRSLWEEFQLPVFALVDADPYGVEIMTVYKYGSKAQAFENQHLAVPSLRWLGILPSDITRLRLSPSVLIPLSDVDMAKATDILNRPFAKEDWAFTDQIQFMIQMGMKAEIQCLDSISSGYISDVYLPSKLSSSNWI